MDCLPGAPRAIQSEVRGAAGQQEAPRQRAGPGRMVDIPVCCMAVGMRMTLHWVAAAGARVCTEAVSRIKVQQDENDS